MTPEMFTVLLRVRRWMPKQLPRPVVNVDISGKTPNPKGRFSTD